MHKWTSFCILYLLYQDFPKFIQTGIESILLNELISIILLLERDKFGIAPTDMIALKIYNKFLPTARGEFASV